MPPQGLAGELEHLCLSSTFLEITSRVVKLCRRESLFLLSIYPVPTVPWCLCRHSPFSPALGNSVLGPRGFKSVTLCGHRRWSTSTFIWFLSRHITHSVSYFSTHTLSMILTLRSHFKQEYWWTLGCCRASHCLVFFHFWCFSFPLWVFFSDSIVVLHCCATESLCSTIMMCTYCVPEIELMTVTSDFFQRGISRSGKHQKANFQR